MRDVLSPKEEKNAESNIKNVFALVIDITDDSVKQLDYVKIINLDKRRVETNRSP
jgi:hypothetical protein